jgi:hypothetical protein
MARNRSTPTLTRNREYHFELPKGPEIAVVATVHTNERFDHRCSASAPTGEDIPDGWENSLDDIEKISYGEKQITFQSHPKIWGWIFNTLESQLSNDFDHPDYVPYYG